MLKKDFLKSNIQLDYQQFKTETYKKSADFISNEMKDNRSELLVPESVNDIERGKFYFVFYDLDGKSSNLEKFNPLFIVDWYDDKNTRYMLGISINFIPVTIRTLFFNMLVNYNLQILEANQKLAVDKQLPFRDITFGKMYKLLQSIGFEWSIRKFDVRKINKVWSVSMNVLPKFVTMSTAQFTGVGDDKLMEIWKSKLEKQEQREREIVVEILGDYKKMQSELDSQYRTVSQAEDNLIASIQQMKNI